MADNGVPAAYVTIVELRTRSGGGTAVIFPGGVPGKSAGIAAFISTARARLSTGAARLGLPSAKQARRMSESNMGSRSGILPGVLASLTGPLGDRVPRGLLELSIIVQLRSGLGEMSGTWGITEEAMAGIAP